MTTHYINSSGNPSSLQIAKLIAEAILEGRIGEASVWQATTNIQQCGGMNARCKAIIHRALKKAGYTFYLALFTVERTDPVSQEEYETRHNKWGIANKEEISLLCQNPELDLLETGYTLGHAAHKLGSGNASLGWKVFWSN